MSLERVLIVLDRAVTIGLRVGRVLFVIAAVWSFCLGEYGGAVGDVAAVLFITLLLWSRYKYKQTE